MQKAVEKFEFSGLIYLCLLVIELINDKKKTIRYIFLVKTGQGSFVMHIWH